MLYKYSSMDALLKFWNSPEYQEAIKLREGIVESNFTVTIELTRRETTPGSIQARQWGRRCQVLRVAKPANFLL
jgi:hypothetical protein